MKRWSRNFDACIQCASTDRKHVGKGLCARCYQTTAEIANYRQEYRRQRQAADPTYRLLRHQEYLRRIARKKEAVTYTETVGK